MTSLHLSKKHDRKSAETVNARFCHWSRFRSIWWRNSSDPVSTTTQFDFVQRDKFIKQNKSFLRTTRSRASRRAKKKRPNEKCKYQSLNSSILTHLEKLPFFFNLNRSQDAGTTAHNLCLILDCVSFGLKSINTSFCKPLHAAYLLFNNMFLLSALILWLNQVFVFFSLELSASLIFLTLHLHNYFIQIVRHRCRFQANKSDWEG